MALQLDEQTDPDPPDPGSQRHPARQIALIVLAGVAVLAAGFGATRINRGEPDWAGTVLPAAQEKPDLTLTDTSGQPYDLRERTEGKFTVLMFGYTNCPDVCPINLATLDTAMETLGPSVRGRIDVVFVTADPARDTPQVLRTYLDQFDADFVGLTGTPEELDAAQSAAKVPLATSDVPDADGGYAVGHATQMIMYGPDGEGRIVYPFGTRQSDWTRDLPRLLAGEEPTE